MDKIKICQLLVGFARVVLYKRECDEKFKYIFDNANESYSCDMILTELLSDMSVVYTDDIDKALKLLECYKSGIEERINNVKQDKELIRTLRKKESVSGNITILRKNKNDNYRY